MFGVIQLVGVENKKESKRNKYRKKGQKLEKW